MAGAASPFFVRQDAGGVGFALEAVKESAAGCRGRFSWVVSGVQCVRTDAPGDGVKRVTHNENHLTCTPIWVRIRRLFAAM